MKERILKILSGLRPEFDFTMDVNMSRTGSSVYVAVAELYISSIYNMGYLAAILENKKIKK